MTVSITLSDAITALVAEKRAVGYKYRAEQQVLNRFEAFSRGEFPGLDTLTEASVRVGSPRRDSGEWNPRPCKAWPRRSGNWPGGWAGAA